MAGLHKNGNLNILQWNARSLQPKLEEVSCLLAQKRVHIALISETWLNEEVCINLNQYNIYRRDRGDSYGGIAIATHISLNAQVLQFNVNNTGIELLCIKLNNFNLIKYIILIYCPSFIHTTQSDWGGIFSMFPKNCLIAGDFNAHHTNWSHKNDNRGN